MIEFDKHKHAEGSNKLRAKRKVRCYKCKEFEIDSHMNKFHLKRKGHTRQIKICDRCLGEIVTSYFEGVRNRE